MHEVILKRPGDDKPGTPPFVQLRAVVDELEELSTQHVKVYRTFVPKHDKFAYIFMTTSKDHHLGLGRFSREVQRHFAMLLHTEFASNGCHELLVFLKNDRNHGGLLVTLHSTNDAEMCFHVSSAR
jgi:hypothetical protein